MAGEFKAPVTAAAELQKAATQYKKVLLSIITRGLEQSLQHMTLRPGIMGKEVVGELEADLQFGPYSETYEDNGAVKIEPRELETFFGSVVKKFSPNSVYNTVWGSLITKGDGLKTNDITQQVLAYLCAQLGINLEAVLWSAKRNPEGHTSKDLFNGFDTITKAEIDANNISAIKGNMFETTKITTTEAVDQLKAIYEASDDYLQSIKSKMFIPRGVYNAYVKDYQTTVGAVPYNTEYEKTFLEGSNGLCELVPLANKKGSSYITLTTQDNMLIGTGAGADNETLLIEKHAPFVLDFVATTFFGANFRTLRKEKLMIAKTSEGSAIV